MDAARFCEGALTGVDQNAGIVLRSVLPFRLRTEANSLRITVPPVQKKLKTFEPRITRKKARMKTKKTRMGVKDQKKKSHWPLKK
ncbi:MAG: hypothetical protein LBC99_04310 [Spirochaetota bacterium]|jgi:hypothetical protein|nr:hypothetical protein [Spirochaetota bacterium]